MSPPPTVYNTQYNDVQLTSMSNKQANGPSFQMLDEFMSAITFPDRDKTSLRNGAIRSLANICSMSEQLVS